MKNASDMGFVKVAALSPTVTVANPEKNAETALAAIKKAAAEGVQGHGAAGSCTFPVIPAGICSSRIGSLPVAKKR